MVPRLAVYGALSTALASAVVGSALSNRPNFFAAAVSVGRSSGALMVLANFGLFISLVFGIVFKVIFFGQLRAVEYEHLFEKLWLFLTESLLALTIFRDDFSMPFAFMYALLLFLKCFHWISADRVDYMDQVPPPGPSYLFHLRIIAITSILLILDVALVIHSINSILTDGVSAMVLFASEFTILLASIVGTILRYSVGVVDIRRARGREDAPSWEAKSMYLFYVDLAVDFMKLLTYLTFFTVILLHYGLPLHILRDVYMTLRSFLSRCGDLIRYRQATRDMDALYPNATLEEMERLGDKTCIICREEMVVSTPGEGQTENQGPNETPKKLGCGHVFHFHCLRSWLERQQSCPTCRRNVLRTPRQARPNARNPVAPAAPGAVPQPNINGGNEALRAAYNQFFQLPGQPAVPPAAAHQPAPTQPANGTSDTTSGAAAPSPNGNGTTGSVETEDQRIQTGIWGGPITPGRFFPTPLGSSRYPQAGPSQPHPPTIIVPRSRPTIITTPSPPNRTTPHRPEPVNETSSSLPPTPTTSSSTDSDRPALTTRDSAPGASGVTTPFSSNPPVIFSATSTSRALEAENHLASLREEEEVSARKAAGEAAMRRFGQVSSGFLHPPGGSVSALPSIANHESLPEVENGIIDKGKGKERVIDSSSLETHYQPFLTPLQVPFASGPTIKPWTSRSVSASSTSNATDIRTSLEERLNTLRQVDGVIWDLVGELSRLKSVWEVEDGDVTPPAGDLHLEHSGREGGDDTEG